MATSPSQIALRTSLLYATAGTVWILTSDGVMLVVSRDPSTLARLSVFKGWAFVITTALLLYATLRTQLARWAAEVARREAAEAEGRAAAERATQYIEHAPFGVLVADLEGREVESNPAAKALRDAGDGDLARVILRGRDEGADEGRLEALRERGRYEGDVAVTREGATRWMHVRAVRIPGDRLLAFVAEVTSSKTAAVQLRKLSQAVEHSSAGILITDRQGNIEYVNARFTQMSGYSLDEVLGKNPRVLKSGETSREEYARLWATIVRGEAWHGEFHNRRKDGTRYWERATIVPIVDDAGEVTHFLNIKDDVTESKSLEAQFRQAQKMEVLGTLAGGVAHDFNNLLTVILGNASLLTQPDADPAESHELVQQIQDAGERAAGLTRQLLLFSRKQALRPVDLDVCEAVMSLAKMLRRVVGAQITVETLCAADALVVRADASMLDQAIMNLSVNARDAMPEGGHLTLRATAVTLDEDAARSIRDATPGRFAVVEVSDTGTGISSSILPQIFEPFFTTKEAGRGTGLGLATVYGIARQHRGWVDVRSVVGEGTTFQLAFPLDESRRIDRVSERGRMVRGTGTVLLIEDDAAVREGMARTLRQCGYRVLEAGTATEAERCLATSERAVDMALIDMLLPGGRTGLELAEALRARSPTLKVLFTSGYDPQGPHTRPLPEGAAFLQKPFSAGSLSLSVARVMRGSSIQPAS